MSDFFVALGLVFVIEGVVFAAFPEGAKRGVTAVLETPDAGLRLVGGASALESPETSLRVAGIASAVLGVVLIWFVRG